MYKKLKRIINYFVSIIYYFKFSWDYPNTKFLFPNKIGTYFSQYGQDLYLSTLLYGLIDFNKKTWVIDVGCNHPINFSNSLYFETVYQRNVLAIDPLSEYEENWLKKRPKAIFINNAVGESVGLIELDVPVGVESNSMFSSVKNLDKKFKNNKIERRTIECRRLGDILDEHKIHDIEFISIDAEGYEMEVLMGIDYEKVKIKCLCIENNTSSRIGSPKIREFLDAKGYVFYARLGWLDDIFINKNIILK